MKIYILLISLVLMLSLVSSIDYLPPVKKGECINIIQTCTSCSYNNLSVIRYPNNGTFALNGDYAMTKLGSVYNYSFCNTSEYGTYFVDGYGDIDGTKTGWKGFYFTVNGSGQEVTLSQIILMILGMSLLLIFSGFFFTLSYIFKHPGTKVFFMSMSALILAVLMGLTSSQFSIYLAEFTGLADFYDKFYYLIVILSSVAMVGLIVWLIWYSLKTFNKVRGRVPED